MDKELVNVLAHLSRHETLLSILYAHVTDGDPDLLQSLRADIDYHFRVLHAVQDSEPLIVEQKARALVAQFFRELADAAERGDVPPQD